MTMHIVDRETGKVTAVESDLVPLEFQKAEAEKAVIILCNDSDYGSMSHNLMVKVYNKYSENKVKKFSDREIAIKRLKGLLEGTTFKEEDKEMSTKKKAAKAPKEKAAKAPKEKAAKAPKEKAKAGRKAKHPRLHDDAKIILNPDIQVNFRQASARGILAKSIDKKGSKVSTVIERAVKEGVPEAQARHGLSLMSTFKLIKIA